MLQIFYFNIPVKIRIGDTNRELDSDLPEYVVELVVVLYVVAGVAVAVLLWYEYVDEGAAACVFAPVICLVAV